MMIQEFSMLLPARATMMFSTTMTRIAITMEILAGLSLVYSAAAFVPSVVTKVGEKYVSTLAKLRIFYL
jgi:hypothetical protein